MKYTAEMTLGQILKMNENVAPILMELGMHCLGCPSAQMETIADAAMVHGIPVEEILEKLNKDA